MNEAKRNELNTPSGSRQRSVKVLDASWDYVQCDFCQCKTNAKLRQCCRKGYLEDGGKFLSKNEE